MLSGKEFIVKTIVTSELLADIAKKFGVECIDVLTGFKYIAEIIRKFENQKKFIGGGEESYGYLVDDFVRDKDAVISCCLIAEAAVYAREQGISFYELLLKIYKEFGLYYESLLPITKKGISGADEIKQMMNDFRNNPPKTIDGSEVVLIKDYLLQKTVTACGETSPIELPKSDVLQFFTADGSKITVRPSGTEPKIKFYFGIKTVINDVLLFDETEQRCKEKINSIKADLSL
jgi:phosphoglucomutase